MKRPLETSKRPQGVVRPDERGFALTLTLIIIALAAVVVIAFLTTTSTERTTAAAYARIGRARQMAEAGVDAAIARLVTEMKYRPYHAIGYRSVNTGLNTEFVPVITGPRTTNPVAQTYNTAPNPAEDVYLVSAVGPAGRHPWDNRTYGTYNDKFSGLKREPLSIRTERLDWFTYDRHNSDPIPCALG
jgi:hypothetical protein